MHPLALPICITLFALFVLYIVLYLGPRRAAMRAEHHVFLDLETYSTRPNAAILAIGAVCVNILGEEVGRIKLLINVKDAMKNGHVDPGTVKWWEEQSDEAKRLTFNDGERFMLADALAKYYAWHKELGQVEGVWGNGATADCIWLRSAYTTVSGEFTPGCPWDFWQERDVRTVVALGWLAKLPDHKKELTFKGTPHNCVDDAAHQARYTTKLIRGLL